MVRKEYQYITDYTLECCMAALMNISMRTAGKDVFEALGLELMGLLKGLLTCDNIGVRSFINGIVFGALS